MLIGLLTLSQYLFGWNIGLDQLLFRDLAGAAETSIPGRPSPHSALTFTLVGLALILVHGDNLRRQWLAQNLALTAAFIALMALIGYAFSISFFFRISAYTGMALHTALAFFVLCAGLLFLHPDSGFMALMTGSNIGSVMARRLLLAAFTIPLVVGWISILGERAELYSTDFEPVLLATLSVYTFSGAIWWYARFLNRMEVDRIQAEEQFRLAVEASPSAIIMVSMDGKINLVNAQTERLFGYSRQELLNQPIEMLVPQQFRTYHNEYRDGFLKNPTARPMGAGRDLFGLRKDGSQVPVEIGLNPIVDNGSRFVLASVIDITERKKAEAQIAEALQREQAARVEAEAAQERFAFLAEAGAILAASLDYHPTLTAIANLAVPRIADWCAVDVVEPDGTINRVAVVHTDPAKVELAYELQRRYPPDPNAPRGIYNVLGTGQAEFYPQISDALLEAAGLDEEQLNLVRELGFQSAIIMPLKIRDRPIGTITCVIDESGRIYNEDDLTLLKELAGRAALAVENAQLFKETKKLNEELEQRVIRRTAELKAANKELEAFAYSVSHDLRAPLRGIDGFSQAILEDYGDRLDDTGRDYLHRVRAGSQRMAQLIDDLLKLSRVTRGEMFRVPVNLSEMAQGIAEELRRIGPERRVEFIIAPDMLVEADRQLIGVLLDNLLGNAWKFTGKVSAARIEFGVMAQPDKWPIYFVRDNGAGFDMTYGDKLFGAFQRLHSAFEFPGTGIGLATVQRVINRHGGRIWADGTVDQGATFYFTLN
jgi:PAS domain S-box-containing protein